MRWQPVAYQDDRTSQMMMHLTQELNDIGRVSIVVEQTTVQVETLGPRCSCQGSQGSDAVVSLPGVLHGRVSDARPDPSTKGLQQIPTFVEKHQASMPFQPPFLGAATFPDANVRFLPRLVRGPAVGASGDSTRVGAAASRHSPHETTRRTTSRSNFGPGRRSSRIARSPKPLVLDPTLSPVPVAAASSGAATAQHAVCELSLVPLVASTLFANDWPKRHCNRPPQPLPSATSPARKAGPRSFDELLALREFLWVSLPECTTAAMHIPLTT